LKQEACGFTHHEGVTDPLILFLLFLEVLFEFLAPSLAIPVGGMRRAGKMFVIENAGFGAYICEAGAVESGTTTSRKGRPITDSVFLPSDFFIPIAGYPKNITIPSELLHRARNEPRTRNTTA
jgi:hypothetical protein